MSNPVLTEQQAEFIRKLKAQTQPQPQPQPQEQTMQKTPTPKGRRIVDRGASEKVRKFFAKNRHVAPIEAAKILGESLQIIYNVRYQLRKKHPTYFDMKKPGAKPKLWTPPPVLPVPPAPVIEVATKNNPYLTKPVIELELPVRAENILKAENIQYIGDLIQRTELELMKMPNMGRKSIADIKEALENIGLTLGMQVPYLHEIIQEKASATPDMVNSPPHYRSGGIETIDFIEAKKLNYNLGNVVKYITRADLKGNRKQDLAKALWYLQREISSMV